MVRVTKAMVNRAESEHFRKEDSPSLVKLHALKSMYYSQKGDRKSAKAYVTGADVKRKIQQIKLKKKRKPVKKKSKQNFKSLFGGFKL